MALSLGTAPTQPTKTLTGRLLDDRLEEVSLATIYARDTTVIGIADRQGYFKLDVAANTNKLLFTAIGMELTTVTLRADCTHLEVILLLASSHDFESVRRVNRQEFKRFKHLPQLHQQAYAQGLFISQVPCASPVFTKWVPRAVKR